MRASSDADPNWILSPTPLNKGAQDSADVVLGMPGPGSRKGRAVATFEINRAIFAPSTGSKWGGSFGSMTRSQATLPPATSSPLASSLSSNSPSLRSLRFEANYNDYQARQAARRSP